MLPITGCGNDLTKLFLTYVTSREDAGHFRFHLFVRFDVAFCICDAEAFEWFCQRKHTDVDEHTVCFKFCFFSAFSGHECHTSDFPVAFVDFFDGMVPDEINFFVIECALLKDLLGAQLIATVNDGHFVRETGEVYPFFYGRVSSSDDNEVFVFEEGTVTYGTVRNTASAEFFFTRDTDFLYSAPVVMITGTCLEFL